MAVAYVNKGTLTYTGTGAGCTPPLPASIVAGNLLVASVFTQGSGGAHVWPAGWTQIDQQSWNSGTFVGSFAYRIATGADSAPAVTWPVSTFSTSQVWQYSGASATPISAARSVATGLTGTHTSAAITTTATNSLVLLLDLSRSVTLLTNPAGWTQDSNAADAGSLCAFYFGEKTVAASGTSSGAVSTAGGAQGWVQWQQEILAIVPTGSSSATLPLITATGSAYSGNSSSIALPLIGASGTAVTGSAGSSAASLALISGTGTAVRWESGAMAKTRQYATKSMTGFWWTSKVRQHAIKSMVGTTGVVAAMAKQGQMPVKSMMTWPAGTMSKAGQAGIKSMLGAGGVIGAGVKTRQYGTKSMSGYVSIMATMGKTRQLAIKSMTAIIGSGLTYKTVSMHTEWQGLTEYTNYPFNSYAKFNDVYLGAGDSGLFTLSGNTDNGAAINAVARMGVTDFGTSKLKKIEYAYVGYRTTGDCMLRVITNDLQTRDYKMPTTGETGLHVKRVKMGKGVIARYYQFEIQNINGADFELNTLELKPTILSRRVFGGRA